MILALVGFFVFGMFAGSALTVFITIHLGRRMLNKQRAAGPKAVADAAPRNSVEERMKRIKDITNEQMELMQAQDHPQKNSLDGRYKNGLGAEIKALEEEKTELLISIIEDGHDPEVTTVDATGEIAKMKLSKFIADSGIKIPGKQAPKPSTGKFTVVRGGKDDGGNTTH